MRTTSLLANKLYADREKTGDIAFYVGSERIMAHKSVLAALSPMYEAQFYSSKEPDDGELLVVNTSPEAFKEFIKYCYIEDCDLSIDIIEELLGMAKQSLLDHFVTKCGQFLIDTMNEGNQNYCWIYRLALMYEIQPVLDSCDIRVNANLPQIFMTGDFLECGGEVLLHILNAVDCTAGEIFEGCIAWARAKCQQKEVDDNDPMNLRDVLRSAIDQIRFKSMNINQFVELDQKYEGFFTAEQFREITKAIVDADRSSRIMPTVDANRLSRTLEIVFTSESEGDDE